MMSMPTFRQTHLLILVVVLGLLGFAFYAQFVLGLAPCPLCQFQRFAFYGLALVCLIAALHDPQGRAGRAMYIGFGTLMCAIGASISARHVWLQNLPADQVPPTCGGMSLSYMSEMFGWSEVVRRVLTTSGECAEVDWSFLGLSMPAWTLLWFVMLAVALLIRGFTRQKA